MAMDISQEPFCVEIYRDNSGRFGYHLDRTPGLNCCRNGHTVWGKTCWFSGSVIVEEMVYLGRQLSKIPRFQNSFVLVSGSHWTLFFCVCSYNKWHGSRKSTCIRGWSQFRGKDVDRPINTPCLAYNISKQNVFCSCFRWSPNLSSKPICISGILSKAQSPRANRLSWSTLRSSNMASWKLPEQIVFLMRKPMKTI